MSEQYQIYLLVSAIVALTVLVGANTVLSLLIMGDVEKFGRLLLKVRRLLKQQAANEKVDAAN